MAHSPGLTAELTSMRDCFTDYGAADMPVCTSCPDEIRAAGRILFGLLLDGARTRGATADDLAADLTVLQQLHLGTTTLPRGTYLGLLALGKLV